MKIGKFHVHIKFPRKYPLEVPEFTMKTKIFHPVINHKGKICIPITENWERTNEFTDVLNQIRAALEKPEDFLDVAINDDALTLFVDSPEEFEKQARRCTEKFGTGGGKDEEMRKDAITTQQTTETSTENNVQGEMQLKQILLGENRFTLLDPIKASGAGQLYHAMDKQDDVSRIVKYTNKDDDDHDDMYANETAILYYLSNLSNRGSSLECNNYFSQLKIKN